MTGTVSICAKLRGANKNKKPVIARESAAKNLQECTATQNNQKLPTHLPRTHQAANKAVASPKSISQLMF